MKKKMLSMILSAALCLSMLPEPVYTQAAENTVGAGVQEEGNVTGDSVSGNGQTASAGDAAAENGVQSALAAVQSLLDTLPTLTELQEADAERQAEIYETLQEAYDAYEALDEEAQERVAGAERFEEFFDWFNAQITVLDEEETAEHTHTPGEDGKCTECDNLLCASVTDEGSTVYYISLSDALKKVTGGETVTLLQNEKLSSPLVIETGITLDLNGKVLDLPQDPDSHMEVMVYAENVVLKDSGENGRITYGGNANVLASVWVGSGFDANVKGGLTLQGGTVEYICVHSGSFCMTGGTISKLFLEKNGTVELSGGVSKEGYIIGENVGLSVRDLLGSDCVLVDKNGNCVTDKELNEREALRQFCSVVPVSLSVSAAVQGSTELTYGYGGTELPEITLTATKKAGISDEAEITYRWYLDGVQDTIQTGSSYTFAPGKEVKWNADKTAAEPYVVSCRVSCNGYTATVEQEITVEPKELTVNIQVTSPDSLYYTGQPVKPRFTLSDENDKWLSYLSSSEYTVEYKNNVYPKGYYAEGEETSMQIVNAPGGNYIVSSAPKVFDIAEGRYEEDHTVSASMEDYMYGDTPSEPTVTGLEGAGDAVITYYYLDKDPTDEEKSASSEWKGSTVAAGTYYLWAKVEIPYYNSFYTDAVSFTVKQEEVTVREWPAVKEIYAMEKLKDADLTGGSCTDAEGNPVAGSFSIIGVNTWNEGGKKTTTVTFTPENSNYGTVVNSEFGVTVKKLVVEKADTPAAVTDKEFGAALAALGLPERIYIVVTGTKSFQVPVTWSGYNPDTLEKQTLTGTPDLSAISDVVEQPEVPVTARVEVTLQALAADTPVFSDKTVAYTGSTQKHELASLPKGVSSVTYTYTGADGTVYAESKTAPVNAGSYTVTAAFTMQYGYAQLAPVTAKLTVTRVSLTDTDTFVTMAGYSYGSTAPAPSVTGNIGNGGVTYYYNTEDGNTGGTRWESLTSTSLDVGTYYLYAVIAATDNTDGFTTKAVSFTVAKGAAPVKEWPAVKEIYIGDTLTDAYLTGGSCTDAEGNPVAGSFSITGKKLWSESGSRTTTITFTPADSEKYDPVVNDAVQVSVKKQTVMSVTGTFTPVTDKRFGTALEELGLPESVSIRTTGGADGINYSGIPVTWSGYNPDTLEKQTLTGTLDLSAISNTVEQPETPVTAGIEVTLQSLEADTHVFTDKTAVYTGEAQTHALASIPDGVSSVTYTYEGADGTVYAESETAPVNAGSYTVTATFTMQYGYAQLNPVSAKLTVAKATLADTETFVTMAGYSYGCTAPAPSVTGNLGNGAVTYYYRAETGSTGNGNTETGSTGGTEWESLTSTSLGAGTYYLYAVIAATDNTDGFTTKEVSFTVTTADAPVSEWSAVKEIYVGDTLTDAYLTGGSCTDAEGNPVAGSFSITGTRSWNESGSRTTAITFTPEDAVNYQAVENDAVGVTVKKRTVAAVTDVFSPITDKETGTAAEALGLPETVSITTADGRTYENLPVVWSGYDAQTSAAQTLTGMPDLSGISEEVEQPEMPVTAEIVVILQPQETAGDGDSTTPGSGDSGSTTPGSGDSDSTTPGSSDGGSTTPGSSDSGSTTPDGGDGGSTTPDGSDGGSTTPDGSDDGSTTPGSSDGGSTTPGSSDGGSTTPGSSDSGSTTPTFSGWQSVDNMLQGLTGSGNGSDDGAAPVSGNVNVRIAGENRVPAQILNTLCGTELTLALQQGNGVALSISGSALNENQLSGLRTLDLTTDTDARTIPEELIWERSVLTYRQLTIRDTGRLAVPVNLHVNMGAENAGQYANFYRYNATLGRLEYCGTFRITENGQAMTGLRQGGSYLVTVTDTRPVERYLFSGDSYTVQSGDTLSKIARRYRMSLEELLRRNPTLRNPNRIRAGQTINVL